MKLTTNVSQTLKQTQKLSYKQQYALKILAMNDVALSKEIEAQLESNALLEQNTFSPINEETDLFEQASLFVTKQETLQDVLFSQLHLCNYDLPFDLADFLIESLDSSGYLRMSDEEIQTFLPSYSIDEIEDTIAILQTFEPAGVFARNLQECLLIQLCFADIPYSQIAIMIVNYHMNDLATHQYKHIANTLSCSLDEIKNAVSLITSLHPKPGSLYASNTTYTKPDAIISVEDETIHIETCITSDQFTINRKYENINDEIALTYIKKAMQDAKILIDSLDKRSETLTAILSCICNHQKRFFIHHEECIPLTMQTIANELGYHESTISRALSQKSIEFENRVIPLKHFFPAVVNGNCTSNIHKKIISIIKREPKNKPYSDEQIAKLLKEEKIEISRRTIAKYREQLSIPPVSVRRKLQGEYN